MAQDQAARPPVPGKGLRGLLVPEVPIDLTEESLESLDGNWAPVRAKLVTSLNRLYENDSLDILGQRKMLEELKAQAAVIRVGISEPRNKSIHRTLMALHGRLSRRSLGRWGKQAEADRGRQEITRLPEVVCDRCDLGRVSACCADHRGLEAADAGEVRVGRDARCAEEVASEEPDR